MTIITSNETGINQTNVFHMYFLFVVPGRGVCVCVCMYVGNSGLFLSNL